MDIQEFLARLGEASDAEIGEALSAIQEQAKAVPEALTEENVAALEGFKAAADAIGVETARRGELATRATAVRSAFTSAEADKAAADEKATADARAAEDAAAAAEGAGTEGGETGTEGEAGEAVTAGASKLGAITKSKAAATVKPVLPVVTVNTKSVGNSAMFNSGQALTEDTLADALLEKHQTTMATSATGRHNVARVEFSYPPERTLTREGVSANTKAIDKVRREARAPKALTAAGGLCAPLETLYDINVLGVTSRPVRDALSRFQVDRGGIQYRMPMDALVMTDGLGIWTAADDAAVSNPPDGTPAKTCAVIECPAVEDAIVQAIYLCLQYPNFTARFDREWVAATTQAALIAQARFAENALLTQLFAGSKLVTAPKAVSAVRDVLVTLDKLSAYYRYRHRLDAMVPLRWIAPRWVLDLFRADMTRGLTSANNPEFLALADAQILAWFRARNILPSFHLDGLPGVVVTPPGGATGTVPAQQYVTAAAGSVVPGFIDKIDSLLFAEGDWLFLDGGTLDLGLVRDSTLNTINRYQTFVETWEGTAFDGIESLRVLMEVQPTGSVTGTIDGSALVD